MCCAVLCCRACHRWEKLGDLVLIPADSACDPRWSQLVGDMTAMWQALAGALGAARLARQAPIASTGAGLPLAGVGALSTQVLGCWRGSAVVCVV